MTAANLTALVQSDLSDDANRSVLNDALLDAGYNVDLGSIWQQGYDDGFDAAWESGSANTPHGGWDTWLIIGAGSSAACGVFGLSRGDIDSEAWIACCRVYHLAAQQGADDMIA